MTQQTLARNLALFSFGLGFAQLLAPRKVARLIGVPPDHEGLLRAIGLREIGSGLGIMQGKASYFLWSRVAGDILDLSLLAAAKRSPQSDQRRLTVAIAAVAGAAVVDLVAATLHSRDYAEPGWRDPRAMSERGGLALEGPRLRTAAEVAMTRAEPLPDRTTTDELTEAPAPRS